jgi:hypothetical protein
MFDIRNAVPFQVNDLSFAENGKRNSRDFIASICCSTTRSIFASAA